MNFYDLGEWKFFDLEIGPNEMINQYGNPEYAEVATRIHKGLERLREKYQVPPDVQQDLGNDDLRYHSSAIRAAAEKRVEKWKATKE